MEGISLQYAGDIVKSVWAAANRIGYSSFFLFEQGGFITDDHLPINRIRNIPTIDIIHLDKNSGTGFYPGWHTTHDNLASIDKLTLKAVGQTLLTVIYEEK
jgi:aminopeptidase-like protein